MLGRASVHFRFDASHVVSPVDQPDSREAEMDGMAALPLNSTWIANPRRPGAPLVGLFVTLLVLGQVLIVGAFLAGSFSAWTTGLLLSAGGIVGGFVVLIRQVTAVCDRLFQLERALSRVSARRETQTHAAASPFSHREQPFQGSEG